MEPGLKSTHLCLEPLFCGAHGAYGGVGMPSSHFICFYIILYFQSCYREYKPPYKCLYRVSPRTEGM